MKNIFKIALTFIVIFTSTFSFHIAPTFFEKRIDGPGGYQEFTMYNNTNKTVRYRVITHPGTGRFDGHFNEWMEVSPKIITIKPQSQGLLKVYVKAPQGTSVGEYSGFLNFTAVPVPELNQGNDTDISAAAGARLSVNMEIIGYVGEEVPKVEVTNLKAENIDKDVKVSFKIKNLTLKRGLWYKVEVIKNNDDFVSFEKGRIGIQGTEDTALTLKNLDKKDIQGIRIVNVSDGKIILKKAF